SSFYRYAREYPILDAQGKPQPLLQHLPPTSGIKLVQREKPGHRSFTEEELQAFFAAIPTVDKNGKPDVQGLKWKSFFLTAFWTARRRAELCNLRWGDIQSAIIMDNGKRRQGYIYQWHGKGRSRELDSMELPEVCYEAIR